MGGSVKSLHRSHECTIRLGKMVIHHCRDHIFDHDKKFLRRECKRHTAHCVASSCYAVRVGTWMDGGTPISRIGVPPFCQWWGTPS